MKSIELSYFHNKRYIQNNGYGGYDKKTVVKINIQKSPFVKV